MKTQEICEQVINYLISDGFRKQVSKKEVQKAIMFIKGIDERTIKRWLKALEIFEFLIPINAHLYEINILKIPHLITVLKENPQTKIL